MESPDSESSHRQYQLLNLFVDTNQTVKPDFVGELCLLHIVQLDLFKGILVEILLGTDVWI